ncbi:peptide chain release factor 3, partial [bacterium]|nr:peptide chain release factor 3 [bacterium]
MGELERVMGMRSVPINWPLGNGDCFRGVYDIKSGQLHLFERQGHGSAKAKVQIVEPRSAEVAAMVPSDMYENFCEEIELLTLAGEDFDREAFLRGEITPVFFGSALSNFGVQLFLDAFLKLAPPPRACHSSEGFMDPAREGMSGFIFKIQADMNPHHRDRVAFLRVCTGRFERGMKVRCMRTGEVIRLSYPQRLFAQERETVDEAFPGDVVGLVNSGELALGDTLTEAFDVHYDPIPLFPPEHFCRVIVDDPSRRKQFNKALEQLQCEGAIQVFWSAGDISRMPIMGAVGQLQFEVVEQRLKTDSGVEARFEHLPYKLARWISGAPEDVEAFAPSRLAVMAEDRHHNPVVLMPSEWDLSYTEEKNPKLKFLAVSPV